MRYPYTYAADMIREHINEKSGTLISRSAASSLQGLVAESTGLSREEIAKALVDKFLQSNNE